MGRATADFKWPDRTTGIFPPRAQVEYLAARFLSTDALVGDDQLHPRAAEGEPRGCDSLERGLEGQATRVRLVFAGVQYCMVNSKREPPNTWRMSCAGDSVEDKTEASHAGVANVGKSLSMPRKYVAYSRVVVAVGESVQAGG